jgi:Protein of unknown function (DUF2971)
MRVYHFLPATWALDDIAKQRIKISEIDQTNDPFELWCVSQSSRSVREALRAYKKEMNEKFGLICFSEDWVNPLLWSHYADKHRGICLGFEVDKRILHKITYVKERSPLRLPLTKETADELLWTKYWDWKYEGEWRIWLQLDEREDDHYFYHFDSQLDMMQLTEVIVGPLCATTESEVKAVLHSDGDDVGIIKARLAFKTFRVVIKKNGF